MKRLDLIIADLERTCADPSCADSSINALAAARELQDIERKYKFLCDKFDSMKSSESIRFLDCINFYYVPLHETLDEILDRELGGADE